MSFRNAVWVIVTKLEDGTIGLEAIKNLITALSSVSEDTAEWLKATGIAEADLIEIDEFWTRELVIGIKEMSDTEPGTQVLTFRVHRYIDGQWMFDDSVDVVPSDKEVVTVSDMHGRVKITMQPKEETQQDYTLPYTLYYQ
ncbi:hypothetical protein ES703_92699 [subsurface metagenome]